MNVQQINEKVLKITNQENVSTVIYCLTLDRMVVVRKIRDNRKC